MDYYYYYVTLKTGVMTAENSAVRDRSKLHKKM